MAYGAAAGGSGMGAAGKSAGSHAGTLPRAEKLALKLTSRRRVGLLLPVPLIAVRNQHQPTNMNETNSQTATLPTTVRGSTVRLWDIYCQQWVRYDLSYESVPARIQATLTGDERDLIAATRLAARAAEGGAK